MTFLIKRFLHNSFFRHLDVSKYFNENLTDALNFVSNKNSQIVLSDSVTCFVNSFSEILTFKSNDIEFLKFKIETIDLQNSFGKVLQYVELFETRVYNNSSYTNQQQYSKQEIYDTFKKCIDLIVEHENKQKELESIKLNVNKKLIKSFVNGK